MPATTSTKIAVFGAGYWGTKLCREYAAIGSSTGAAQLSYVVDSYKPALDVIERELAATPSALSSKTRIFSNDYETVLHDAEIDAVHIALPNHLHYKVARAALEAGKHVLLEKPIATTSRDAFKLARLAEERGLVLQVGHIFRFNNALRTVKEIIKSGQLGKIFYANLSWATYMEPIPKDRDIVFDLAPHPVDVLNYLLEEWPIGVDAIGDSYVQKRENAEEMAFVNLEFPDEILANIYLSWIHHGAKERSIRLICQKGTIYCDAIDQKIYSYYDHKSSEVPVFPVNVPSLVADGCNVKLAELTTGANNTIRDMQYHFLERIRGRGPQMNSALVGAQTVAVLEKITNAMRIRRKVKIQQSSYPTLSP